MHRRDLPGNPDIVLPKHRTAVFVHGCFWHQHPGCKKATRPQQNAEFWKNKLEGNVKRDRQARSKLEELGWRVLVLWECEAKRYPDTVITLRRRETRRTEGRYSLTTARATRINVVLADRGHWQRRENPIE